MPDQPYVPNPKAVAADLGDLLQYTVEELQKVQNAIAAVSSTQLPELHAEPTRKYDRMMVFADGTDWNPGEGKGLYIWLNDKWNFFNLTPTTPPEEPLPPPEEPEEPPPPPDPDVPIEGAAVSTFHCLSLYWRPPNNPGPEGVRVMYREVGTLWPAQPNGHPLWYDPRDGIARGSIVHLQENTEYEVLFYMPGETEPSAGLRAKTWGPFLEKGTTEIASRTTQLNITAGGSETAGYQVYKPPAGQVATIDPNGAAEYCIRVQADYVIIRGFFLKRPFRSGILIDAGRHHVIIEDCDISGWGGGGTRRTSDGWLWGWDRDSAIRVGLNGAAMGSGNIIVQRNKMHNPRYGSNSWSDGHPSGPQAVTFLSTYGNNVIRYNEVWSDNIANYFNDGFSGLDNMSENGFPGPDSDIYGNSVRNCWDDCIEAEGGGKNVRIWWNYTDHGSVSVGTTPVHLGPCYIWRNVFDRQRHLSMSTWATDTKNKAFKVHSTSSWGRGRRYIYHNTLLQRSGQEVGVNVTLGAGEGIAGGGGQPIENTKSRNNILHVWKDTSRSIRTGGTGVNNDFDYDLFNGQIEAYSGAEANGIKGTPTYKSGHGPTAGLTITGKWQLAAGTPGHDDGEVIPNFSDGFLGAAPDRGAHEEGSADMTFGVLCTVN